MNKNNRTDAEEAAANKAGGTLNQIAGRIKETIGDVVGDRSLKSEGRHDKLQGRLQEDYGDLKEREAEIEEQLDDISGRGRV